MKFWKQSTAAALCIACGATAWAQTPTSYDESIELERSFGTGSNSTTFIGFKVVGSTDPLLASLGIGNPILFLEVGKRYRIVNSHVATHSFALIGDGPGLDDVVLLDQGGTTGSAENLSSINWHEAAPNVYFTFSQELLTLMSASGREPRYTSTPSGSGRIFARGATSTGFTWTGDSVPQVETFESGTIGGHIFSARNDWFVSSSDPLSLYTAKINNLPAGAAGQAVGSTRWLRVADAYQPDDTLNSVVTAAVEAPGGLGPIQYTWEFRLNVETKPTNSLSYIGLQHFDAASGTYKRAWGLDFFDTLVGVSLDSSILSSEAAGSTTGIVLYDYTQSGFGANQWVQVILTADFERSSFTATVYPSNGGSPVTQTIDLPGEAFAATIAKGNFRFAIDNTAPNQNSTLCIDNLTLQTSTGSATGVASWEQYQ